MKWKLSFGIKPIQPHQIGELPIQSGWIALKFQNWVFTAFAVHLRMWALKGLTVCTEASIQRETGLAKEVMCMYNVCEIGTCLMTCCSDITCRGWGNHWLPLACTWVCMLSKIQDESDLDLIFLWIKSVYNRFNKNIASANSTSDSDLQVFRSVLCNVLNERQQYHLHYLQLYLPTQHTVIWTQVRACSKACQNQHYI